MQQIAYSDTKQKHSDITKDHQSTVYSLISWRNKSFDFVIIDTCILARGKQKSLLCIFKIHNPPKSYTQEDP